MFSSDDFIGMHGWAKSLFVRVETVFVHVTFHITSNKTHIISSVLYSWKMI